MSRSSQKKHVGSAAEDRIIPNEKPLIDPGFTPLTAKPVIEIPSNAANEVWLLQLPVQMAATRLHGLTLKLEKGPDAQWCSQFQDLSGTRLALMTDHKSLNQQLYVINPEAGRSSAKCIRVDRRITITQQLEGPSDATEGAAGVEVPEAATQPATPGLARTEPASEQKAKGKKKKHREGGDVVVVPEAVPSSIPVAQDGGVGHSRKKARHDTGEEDAAVVPAILSEDGAERKHKKKDKGEHSSKHSHGVAAGMETDQIGNKKQHRKTEVSGGDPELAQTTPTTEVGEAKHKKKKSKDVAGDAGSDVAHKHKKKHASQ